MPHGSCYNLAMAFEGVKLPLEGEFMHEISNILLDISLVNMSKTFVIILESIYKIYFNILNS
jgi:hypothetical protein